MKSEIMKEIAMGPAATKIAAGLQDAIDWSQCPHCADRRAKKAAQMQRHREKKRG